MRRRWFGSWRISSRRGSRWQSSRAELGWCGPGARRSSRALHDRSAARVCALARLAVLSRRALSSRSSSVSLLYTQLLLPFVAGAAVIGMLIGLPFGTSLLLGRSSRAA